MLLGGANAPRCEQETTFLCAFACLLFQALPLTQLQSEMDDATQLVNSIFSGKAIDVDALTAAKKHVETALGIMTASGLAADPELPGFTVAVKAEELISSLNVKA